MKIYHFGTFDVANYGDLLFPHVLRHRLAGLEADIELVSPKGGRPAWQNTITATPVADLLETCEPGSAAIIGGGNILHMDSTSLPDYADRQLRNRWSYAALWIGATYLMCRTGGRLVWNAAGAPLRFRTAEIQSLAKAAVQAADYACVRDRASAAQLCPGQAELLTIVPDTAFDIAALWPARSLARHYRAAFESRGMAVPERTVCIHLNSRYLDRDDDAVAALVAQIAGLAQAMPILLAIGPCHGDDLLAQRVSAHMTMAHLCLDKPASLKEIAACLAHSVLYCGSSMHGFITAFAHGKPGVMIANPKVSKFPAVTERVGNTECLLQNWGDVPGRIDGLLRRPPEPAVAEGIRADLDTHWQQVSQALVSPVSHPEARARFLDELAQLNERHGGWNRMLAGVSAAQRR